MKRIQLIAMTIFAGALTFSACKKDNNIVANPQPVEQELITTLKLVVTNGAGFNKTFSYKVENGFNNITSTVPEVDEVQLAPGTQYNVEVQVWNEKASPAENVTGEVKTENEAHLFLFSSTPASRAGSVTFSNGSTDDAGKPFNQAITFTTGDAGSGSLTVTLKHEPTDKNATTPDAAGGETDAQAIFPVKIQ